MNKIKPIHKLSTSNNNSKNRQFDKKERSYKRMALSFCICDNNCDCCGETRAWNFNGGSLCIKCEDDTIKFLNKIWWLNK